jgi:hypothetical protein
VVPSEQGHISTKVDVESLMDRDLVALRPGRVWARDAQEQAARGHLAEALPNIR